MRNLWAALVTGAAVAAAGIAAPFAAKAGDFGPGLTVGVANGALTAGAVAAAPYGYVYGPLPYGPYYRAPVYAVPDDDRVRVYHGSRIARARRVHRSSRIHSIARVHHVARAYHVLDPYYDGGPFYHHHYCCRYW